MIITELEATIKPENWDEFRKEFKKIFEDVPSEITQTLLLQNTKESESWRIMTLWKSKEAFIKKRKEMADQVPPGYLLVRAFGTEGAATMSDIMESSPKA